VASDNIERDYKTLHLEPEASFDEVKRAYRSLVKVWHPDRFAQTPHMQQQALEKLQVINRAYANIRSASLPPCSRSTPAPMPSNRGATSQETPGKAVVDCRSSAETGRVPTWTIALAAFITLRLLVAYVLAGTPWPQALPLTPAADVLSSAPAVSLPTRVQQPAVASAPAQVPAAEVADHGASLPPGSVDQPYSTRQYFTVGSTKAEVLAVQGTPSLAEAHLWEYGGSRVYFRYGKVTRWEVWPRWPLKVRLLPATAVDTMPPYFTVGSTKDEVLSIQGTPSRFTERVWDYGQSRVYFDGDRVSRWHEWRGSPLKARPLLTDAG
jgi:hypothetical protein